MLCDAKRVPLEKKREKHRKKQKRKKEKKLKKIRKNKKTKQTNNQKHQRKKQKKKRSLREMCVYPPRRLKKMFLFSEMIQETVQQLRPRKTLDPERSHSALQTSYLFMYVYMHVFQTYVLFTSNALHATSLIRVYRYFFSDDPRQILKTSAGHSWG